MGARTPHPIETICGEARGVVISHRRTPQNLLNGIQEVVGPIPFSSAQRRCGSPGPTARRRSAHALRGAPHEDAQRHHLEHERGLHDARVHHGEDVHQPQMSPSLGDDLADAILLPVSLRLLAALDRDASSEAWAESTLGTAARTRWHIEKPNPSVVHRVVAIACVWQTVGSVPQVTTRSKHERTPRISVTVTSIKLAIA